MAKKKNITPLFIISAYMNSILEHGEQPKNVYAFAKNNNFDEAKFYEFYSSFEVLEENIFSTFGTNTLQVLSNSEEFETFDARNKLLSFYYTFFEQLTANRSYVVYSLTVDKKPLQSLKLLKELKHVFTAFIESLDLKTLDLNQERLERIQHKAINETAWIQFILTLKFWLDDTSSSFDKTDQYIEKSVNASFDLIDNTPLKSIVDFGKFIFKEKLDIRS
ncbi:TetR/AcrR family transcriptional regulator [Kordia sp. YSTF-M3]|uniref:TetR/AcrR family transcriptional regulator n=1 Tax=Kordia aestuariivivens TaxID=2759037 RepID=A0ABR7Q697_9FLAO|nr:TetR family transcriptional regulator C-terminal domain-containing protein [Kordia aestuariivivens]MBC8754018.1 TetR/AcrR family transcriptional regulator [Kordia aestuariivivens]